MEVVIEKAAVWAVALVPQVHLVNTLLKMMKLV